MSILKNKNIKIKIRNLFCVLICLLIILNTQAVFAASCPHCGQQYGDPMPGDENRVYALRAQHEATCPSRISTPAPGLPASQSGNDGGWQKPRQQEEQHLQELKESEVEAKQREETHQRQFEQDKQEALKMLKSGSGQLGLKDTNNNNDLSLISMDDDLKPGGTSFFGLGGGDSSVKGNSNKSQETLFSKGSKTSAPVDLRFLNIESDPQEMLKEQTEFDKMNDIWIERQKKIIRETALKNKDWNESIITSIKTTHVRSPLYQPRDMDDLQPGDILLIAPEENDSISNTVALLDHIYTRRILTTSEKQSPVSHALTVVKTVNGKLLFLDHTSTTGSHIFGEKEFLKNYGHRGIYFARPQSKVDGKILWQTAQEAAKKTIKDDKVGWDWTTYGVFGKDAVCSEIAALAVVKATGKPLFKKNLIDKLKPIDVTPADLYDPEYFGNYFVVTPLVQK